MIYRLKELLKKNIPIVFTIFLLTIGIFFFFRPIFTSSFHYSQSGIGDTVLNNFFLEHSFQMVTNHAYTGSWWSPLFFYPQSNTLTYSDNLWGTAPLYWLFRIIFLPFTAFQLWMIGVAILNYVSFYLLSRTLKMNTWFSSFGSFLFAFGLPSTMQLGHQQLLPRFYVVFAILFLYKYLINKKPHNFALFLIFTYLQLLAGIYLGWFLIFTAPIFIIAYTIYHKDKIILRSLLNYKILASLILFLLATTATMLPYARTQKELGGRSYGEIQTMIPSVISYVNFPSGAILHQLYPSYFENEARLLPMRHEQYLFIGIFFIFLSILTLIAFVRNEKSARLPPIFIIGILIFILLTILSIRIPFTNFSLWEGIYNFIPGAGVIRAVARIWTISYIFLFLAVMILVSDLFLKTTSKVLKSILFILAFLSCVEQINLTPNYFNKDQQLAIQAQINETIKDVMKNNELSAFYLQWPNDQSYIPFQTKAAWASLELNLPTVNGYSGNVPRNYKTIESPMTIHEVDEWLQVSGKSPHSQKTLFLTGSIQNGTFKLTTSTVFSLPTLNK